MNQANRVVEWCWVEIDVASKKQSLQSRGERGCSARQDFRGGISPHITSAHQHLSHHDLAPDCTKKLLWGLFPNQRGS